MPAKHPFTPAALSKKPHPALDRELPSNQPADIKARQDEKKKVDLDNQSLLIVNQTSGRPFTVDFSPLATRYVSSIGIIKQLLVGADIHVGKRLVTYQTHQDAYYSIKEFVEFINSSEPKNKSIAGVADIDGQICLNFRSYLIRMYPGRTVNRKRYGALRSIVTKLQKKFKNELWAGSIFTWPKGPDQNERPTEGYNSEIHNALIDGSLSDIKQIIKWMTQDQCLSTVEVVTERDLKIENVMYELVNLEKKKAALGGINPNHVKWFEWVIRSKKFVRDYIEQEDLSIEQFLKIYRTKRYKLAAGGKPLKGTKIDEKGLIEGATPEYSASVAIATTKLLYPSWPMQMPFDDAMHLFSGDWSSQFASTSKHSTKEIKLRYLVIGMKFSLAEHNVEIGQMAYISSMMFTMNTIFPFILLLLIQTGWNFETLISLGLNLDDYIESDLLDSDYVIIYGMKGRTNKSQMHRSNKRDKFGAYQLLMFIHSVLVKNQHSPHVDREVLFQFIFSKNLWGKYNRLCSEVNSSSFSIASTGFLLRHGIDLGEKKSEQKIEIRRLRTTYETRRREQGFDLEEMATNLGHADIDTTIRHYDSDSGSSELLNSRLRSLQDKHENDLRLYSAKILSDCSLIELRKATDGLGKINQGNKIRLLAEKLKVKSNEVVNLLSPQGQTYIASCLDASSPDWPGAERFVTPGTRCNYFNRCPLCTKCVIFEESLPFITRRVKDLEGLKIHLNFLEWEKNYSEEYQAFSEILDAWGNPEAVSLAYSICMQSQYTLPLSMRGPS